MFQVLIQKLLSPRCPRARVFLLTVKKGDFCEMGKQKRNRYKPHKENPTGLPSSKDFDEETDVVEENKEKALQRVLEQVRISVEIMRKQFLCR